METLLNLLEKHYFQPLGLVVGYAILFVSTVSMHSQLQGVVPSVPIRLSLFCLILICWFFIWAQSRTHFPQIDKDKIGIVIAIDAENMKQKIRLKSDFAERLRQALYQSNLFGVLVLGDYKASRAAGILRRYCVRRAESARLEDTRESNELKRIQKRIRGHFYIWGNIKERLNQENTYFMSLDGLVVHQPVSFETSEKIRKEFLSIFPKEISFYERFEMKGFNFAADTVYLAARYVTGIAAFFSGDPATAIRLHDRLKEEIDSFAQPLPPNLVHVTKQLSEMIISERTLLAKHKYFFENDVRSAKTLLDDCLCASENQYDAIVCRAYIAFKEDRDPVQALRLLHRARRVARNDFTWLYNKAFLWMYLEKFEKGLKDYKKLSNLTFEGEENIVDQCIQFNEELMNSEPDKIQSLFVIGYLYLRKKLNYPMALEYFEKFKVQAKERPRFKYLMQVSLSYIGEINSQMQLSRSGQESA